MIISKKIIINSEHAATVQKDIETGVIKIKYTKFGNKIKLTDREVKDLISNCNFSSSLSTDIYCRWKQNEKGEFI